MIFRKTRVAFGAGYRAGMAGASHTCCPYSDWEFLQVFAWYSGWQQGMRIQLINHLTRRK